MRCPECNKWISKPTETERDYYGLIEYEQWTCDCCNCGWLMRYIGGTMEIDEHGTYFKRRNGKELMP